MSMKKMGKKGTAAGAAVASLASVVGGIAMTLSGPSISNAAAAGTFANANLCQSANGGVAANGSGKLGYGACITYQSGGRARYMWLGTFTASNGDPFFCIDHDYGTKLTIDSTKSMAGIQNKYGTRIDDKTIAAVSYLMETYAPKGTSNDWLTNAALEAIFREAMGDGSGLYPKITTATAFGNTSYGLPASVLNEATKLWNEARTHYGPYTTTISGLPATLSDNTDYSVHVSVKSATGQPMANVPVTATVKNLGLQSSLTRTTAANGDAVFLIHTTGTGASSFSVVANNLPGVSANVAYPASWGFNNDLNTQRGLVATTSTATSAATANRMVTPPPAKPTITTPTVSTAANTATANTGDTLYDNATVGNISTKASDGSAVTNTLGDKLYGPVDANNGSCDGVSYANAPVAYTAPDQTVTADGTVKTGSFTVKNAGCYSWGESLTSTDNGTTLSTIQHTPGATSETTLVNSPITTPTVSTTASDTVTGVGTVLSDTATVGNILTQTATGETVTNTLHDDLYGPVSPVNGACDNVSYANAPIAYSAPAQDVTANTSYKVGAFTVKTPGCYSWSENLTSVMGGNGQPETPVADVKHAPGNSSETTIVSSPTVSTVASANAATVGQVISDNATTTNIDTKAPDGSTITNTLGDKLYGPVAPNGDSCDNVSYANAPVAYTAASQNVTTSGVTKIGSFTVKTPGCYSWGESLVTTNNGKTITNIQHQPGTKSETVLVNSPVVKMQTLVFQVDTDTIKGSPLATSIVTKGDDDGVLKFREERALWHTAAIKGHWSEKTQFVTLNEPVGASNAQIMSDLNAQLTIGHVSSLNKTGDSTAANRIVTEAWLLDTAHGAKGTSALSWGANHNLDQRFFAQSVN